MTRDRQGHPDRSPAAEQERKERVLTQGKPSITRSIADAVVVKDSNLFFLSEPDARVPLDRRHGLGLYYHDCRYLNGYELRVGETRPNLLVSSAVEGFKAIFEFSNPDIRTKEGRLIPAQEVGIKWERVVHGSKLTLHDRLSFHNFGLQSIEFPVSLTFRAEFEDVFMVRGLLSERPGSPGSPRCSVGTRSSRRSRPWPTRPRSRRRRSGSWPHSRARRRMPGATRSRARSCTS